MHTPNYQIIKPEEISTSEEMLTETENFTGYKREHKPIVVALLTLIMIYIFEKTFGADFKLNYIIGSIGILAVFITVISIFYI